MRVKISILMIIFFISGCAWGDRRPFLTYAPILTPQQKNNITLKIVTFSDKRTIKDTIGYSRNAYGMRCAKFIPQNSVTEWVTNALKSELTNAGYSITSQETTPNVIEGEVFDIFCDVSFAYEGSVGIKVVLTQSGKVVLDKQYSSKKNGGVNWAATETTFAKTLEMTLQDTLRQAVFDINKELLKQ